MTEDQAAPSHRNTPALAVESLSDDELRILRDAFPLPMDDAENPRYDYHRRIHAECARRNLS